MKEATARTWTTQLVEHPVPGRTAAQLRLALELLPAAVPAAQPIPLRAHAPVLHVGLQPRLAWPDRPTPVRRGGLAVERRADFYEWILLRRRRAQMAARRAVEGES